MTQLILASTSPRRAELLRQIGVRFTQQAFEVDESALPGELAAHTALRLARLKAETAARFLPDDHAVLAADTLVGLEGEALGKPHAAEDAKRMLRRLSGRVHEVYSGVALAFKGEIHAFISLSHVHFRPLSDAEIHAYVHRGEPLDKAGSYALQGLAAAFITRLEGSYSGVMGLPLFETAELLRQAGLPIWNHTP